MSLPVNYQFLFGALPQPPVSTAVNVAQANSASSTDVQRVKAAILRIGCELGNKLQSKGSFCLATISLVAILGMAFQGLKEEDKTVFLKALDLHGVSSNAFLEAISVILRSLTVSSDTTNITLANLMAMRSKIPQDIHEDFKRLFQGEVFSGSDVAETTINAWVAGKTQGQITDLLQPGSLHYAGGALVNALYFEGLWQETFDEAGFCPFTFADGTQAEVQMIKRKGRFLTRFLDDCSLVEIPYQSPDGRRLSFLAVLPYKKEGLSALLQNLTPLRLQEMRRGQEIGEITLLMPKLKVESRCDTLKEKLEEMGIPIGSELSLLGPDMSIEKIIQMTKLDLDAKGTRMASGTAATVTRGMSSHLSLTQPYAYFIFSDDTELGRGTVCDQTCLITKDKKVTLESTPPKRIGLSRPLSPREVVDAFSEPSLCTMREHLFQHSIFLIGPQICRYSTPNFASFIGVNHSRCNLELEERKNLQAPLILINGKSLSWKEKPGQFTQNILQALPGSVMVLEGDDYNLKLHILFEGKEQVEIYTIKGNVLLPYTHANNRSFFQEDF